MKKSCGIGSAARWTDHRWDRREIPSSSESGSAVEKGAGWYSHDERSFANVTQNVSQAENALLRWVRAAQKIQSDQLHKMAKTMLQHWDGILGFWRFGNMTNASMKGFNNMVRTMLWQAYGYRYLEYMRFKISNQSNNNIKIVIWGEFFTNCKEAYLCNNTYTILEIVVVVYKP